MPKIWLPCAGRSKAEVTRCPICKSIEVEKRGRNYNCKQCKTKFNDEERNIEECEED